MAAEDFAQQAVSLAGKKALHDHASNAEAIADASLALYHACNCLVGQADPDSTVATVLTPALVAYEQAAMKGQRLD